MEAEIQENIKLLSWNKEKAVNYRPAIMAR